MFDPLPNVRELALSAGRDVFERGPTGLVVRREGTGQQWSGDRVPAREEIERSVEQEIERLDRNIRARERAGEQIRAEERALLETYRRTREALANPTEHQTRALEANTRRAFGRSRAVGSTMGIAIIASAALGWYISLSGGGRPPALASLQLPGC